MKRNLLLFSILVALLTLTYLIQEKGAEKEYITSLTRDRIFTGKIEQIKLPHVTAQKTDDQWKMGQQLLSHNLFRQIEKRLTELKVIKTIEGDPDSYFADPFHFEVNGEQYRLGELSLDQQSFYLAQGDKVMLAIIEGDSLELTRDEKEIAGIKYREFKSLLNKPLNELLENQLFRYYPNLPLDLVAIDADGLPEYSLDLKDNATRPLPIPGVRVHDDLRKKFLTLITQMTIKQQVDFKSLNPTHKVSSIRLQAEHKVTWELHLKAKGSADVYLLDPQGERAWLMVGGTLRAFFATVQDYWDKKVIPPDQFKNFSRLSAKIIQGDQAAEVTILNQEPLKFEIKSYKLQPEAMNKILMLIFNLGHHDQASRVSLLTPTDRRQMLNENLIRLVVMDQELMLWPKGAEVVVANLTQGFKAHFLGAQENFPHDFKDVLK